jgi:hypothetical protein
LTSFTAKCARRSIPIFVASLTLVACTGNNTSRGSAPTEAAAIALAPFAQQYAAIVAPIDPAIDRFGSSVGVLKPSASVDEFVAIARPFAHTLADVDNRLRGVKWPPGAAHDIRAELSADQSLRADLTGTSDVTLIVSLWRQQVTSAAGKARDAKRAVSIDLGLIGPA